MKHPRGPVHFQVRWHLNSNGNGTQNIEQRTKRKLKNITTSSKRGERCLMEREGKRNGMEGRAGDATEIDGRRRTPRQGDEVCKAKEKRRKEENLKVLWFSFFFAFAARFVGLLPM